MSLIFFNPPTETVESIPRRDLFWLLMATLAPAAIAGELQRWPGRRKVCEPLANPFDKAFDPAFGAGVGMQCATSDLPASPKIIVQATPP
jgi:hypothetical protein